MVTLVNPTYTFSLIGFVVIPVISKLVGCKNCEVKEDCQWMADKKKELAYSKFRDATGNM